MDIFYNTNFKERNGQITECEVQKFEHGVKTQSVTLKVGTICKMETSNKAESESQFREGTIEEFIRDDIGNPMWAAIRFFDTDRVMRVELTTLI
ncbi:hypothetical protein HP570_25785 [Brevibacillus sp. RS1.1]|uniref:hypothetical protein n=1 Tax=Brevibacillus sp. RS1.1 TaxID=2738982 RepID=UPI00156A925C|nr:hypothetical protein [Brevibacillus sp. RS1.1]NRR05628.1 hypothetical protein [Brevibacillus sp. RS1.1]